VPDFGCFEFGISPAAHPNMPDLSSA